MDNDIYILKAKDKTGKEFVLASTRLTPVKREAEYQIHKGALSLMDAPKPLQIREFRKACSEGDFEALKGLGIKKVTNGHKTY